MQHIWLIIVIIAFIAFRSGYEARRYPPHHFPHPHRRHPSLKPHPNANSTNHNQRNLGVILPALAVAVAIIATIGVIIHDRIHNSGGEDREPEEQINLILCHEDNAAHEYNLVFRVGCPSADFDMRNGFVEFVILGPGEQPIGTPVRFDCSRLPDRVCGEMHCLIGHITRMPPIVAIRAYHGDRRGTIFFYEYVLIDLADDSIIDVVRFNVYLTNQLTTYRGTSLAAAIEQNDDEDILKFSPELLPLIEWTVIELTVLAFFAVMLIAAITMLFEYNNGYPIDRREQGSLRRSLLDLAFVSPLALLIFAPVALVHKYCIKRNALRDEFSIFESHTTKWRWAARTYLFFLLMLSAGFAVVSLYYGTHITFLKSVYWLCSYALILVTVIGCWAAANKSLWFKSLFGENAIAQANATSGKELRANLCRNQTDTRSTMMMTMNHDPTIFFSGAQIFASSYRDLQESSFGPKLQNPIKQQKQQQLQLQQQQQQQQQNHLLMNSISSRHHHHNQKSKRVLNNNNNITNNNNNNKRQIGSEAGGRGVSTHDKVFVQKSFRAKKTIHEKNSTLVSGKTNRPSPSSSSRTKFNNGKKKRSTAEHQSLRRAIVGKRASKQHNNINHNHLTR